MAVKTGDYVSEFGFCQNVAYLSLSLSLQVCDEKEATKTELDKLKSEMDVGRGRGGGGGGALADQATHLQAENTALIKSMQGTYIQYVLFSHDKSLQETI